MFRVTILRYDSASSPVVYEHVKHVWWHGSRLNLAIGEHKINRVYIQWPESRIDHLKIEELEPPFSDSTAFQDFK